MNLKNLKNSFGGDFMNINMVKFEESNVGWNIVFEIRLDDIELLNLDPKSLDYIGDYEIVINKDLITFTFELDKGELKENETIDERLKLIKTDITSIINSCLKPL